MPMGSAFWIPLVKHKAAEGWQGTLDETAPRAYVP